jgi:hypothetical protein
MIVAVMNNYHFMFFNGISWEIFDPGSPKLDNFTTISEFYSLPPQVKHHYLYLNETTTLDINNIPYSEITLMIKQCHNAIYSIKWPDNILWENKNIHNMTQLENAIDFIKLYRLPETNHLLGNIIAQNINY